LLRLEKDQVKTQPRILLVAPTSGHFATLLRGTAWTLLVDHDVYLTDWHNAREVGLWHGRFDIDDFIGKSSLFSRFLVLAPISSRYVNRASRCSPPCCSSDRALLLQIR
jgi:poly-beta-hydroxyalkanoate depolymerase